MDETAGPTSTGPDGSQPQFESNATGQAVVAWRELGDEKLTRLVSTRD